MYSRKKVIILDLKATDHILMITVLMAHWILNWKTVDCLAYALFQHHGNSRQNVHSTGCLETKQCRIGIKITGVQKEPEGVPPF